MTARLCRFVKPHSGSDEPLDITTDEPWGLELQEDLQ
jgi:hypothetical protein